MNYFVKTRDICTIKGTWWEMDLGNIEFIGTREKFLDSVLLQDQLIHGLGKNYLAFSNLRTRGAEVI